MQPVVVDSAGVVRFLPNKIIQWLFDTGKMNLNEIARNQEFHERDHMQIAQLLGYSVSGYGDLSYASEDSVITADALADAMLNARKTGE